MRSFFASTIANTHQVNGSDFLSILGKKEIYYLGPFGLACYYAGMTFIDRKKRSDALNTLTEAVIQNKRQGLPVLVFPEGTRHHDRHTPSLLPFKKGAFVAAIEAQVGNQVGY